MPPKNAYATLAEYNAYITASGQSITTDSSDDGVIESLLEGASVYINEECGRAFYPYIQTRYYDVPYSRELLINEDLLEVLTLTNGDGATLPSTEYSLIPKNISPSYAIKIHDVSAYNWLSSTVAGYENAISLLAIYGYHDRYARDAWKVGTTTTEALDASETEFDVTSSALFSAGQIIRYDNEIGVISSVTSGKINVSARGDNGSAATTHNSGITVYIWKPAASLKIATLELANSEYNRRFGKNTSTTATITASGVVLSPQDIPTTAARFIATHRRIT